MVEARVKAIKSARRDELIQAHRIARWVGFAQPPELKSILRAFDGPEHREPMTEDEIFGAMGLWEAAVNNSPLIKRGEGR